MSYLVLARKWRPKRFSELVGQEHVVRALGNALDTGRVHHAFLFTGTRGVGKTTIARIFAKSLNCEKGTSAEPCGQCAACMDIDAGRYIDLLEIDAASNTGVDDVREVIENAQYMPSRGQYKVYLIDEVHMLSKAAFNALLKTLEEPPGHVKFLLATTDPQKLPVTVLSRCLQFNLKRLDEGQIEGQMNKILAAEQIEADAAAIRLLARGADGSLRDGLSLLDQAIAYAGGALGEDTVRAMLGSVDRTQVAALLDALAGGDGDALLATVESLAGFAPDWGNVLEALAEALHRIQVRQLVPSARREDEGIDVDAYAGRVRPEVVQLWYQMAVNGRRDLDLAPAPRIGFEMSVLRMLAFRPEADAGPPAPGAGAGSGASVAGATSGTGSRAASASAPAAAAPVAPAAAAPIAPDAAMAVPAAAPAARAEPQRKAPDPSDPPPWEVPVAAAPAPRPQPPAPVSSGPRGPAPSWPEHDGAAAPASSRAAAAVDAPAPSRAAPAIDAPTPARAAPGLETDTPRPSRSAPAFDAPAPSRTAPGHAPGSARPAAADALQAGIVIGQASTEPMTAPAPMPAPAGSTAAPGAAAPPSASASTSASPGASAPVEPPAAPVASGSHAAPSSAVIVTDTEDWLQRVAACELGGPARQLASHTAFVSHANDMLTLALDPGFEYLRSERSLAALSEALAAQLGGAPKIVVQDGAPAADTLHRRKDRERDSRQSAAEQAFLNDPTVRRLVEQHGARVVPDSIRPVEEN